MNDHLFYLSLLITYYHISLALPFGLILNCVDYNHSGMETLTQFSETHRSSVTSLKPLIVIILIINLIFVLEFYYQDSLIAYIILNLLLMTALCVFLAIKLTLYFKDKKTETVSKFGPGSP